LVIAAIAATGQARSFAIATTLSTWLRTRLDSAVNRFYRLLRNGQVDYLEFATRWLDLLARRPDRKVLLAVDWTEWHHDMRLLVAAMVTGKRAIPILTQGWRKMVSSRSQNTRENTFLRHLDFLCVLCGVSIGLQAVLSRGRDAARPRGPKRSYRRRPAYARVGS
jgi:hypothetical protein